MRRRSHIALVAVMSLATMAILAVPGFAQTSSDCPGGGTALRLVTGGEGVTAPATAWAPGSAWDALTIALQQRLAMATMRWNNAAPQAPARSGSFVLPRRPGLIAGGLRGRP
jgi:hypothetical protein